MANQPKKGQAGSQAQQTARGEKMGHDVQQPVSAAELAKTLKGVDFPAKRSDLESYAKSHEARNEIIDRIHQMPDKQYTNMADVEHGFGQAKKK